MIDPLALGKCVFSEVPPPLYSEKDPLEPPSSGASSTSDDSFDDWRKDELEDDDESGVETGPNWSGGYNTRVTRQICAQNRYNNETMV